MDMTSLKRADLVDAMGRMHRHRCHILDLVSPTPRRTLFGQAVTISYFTSCSADLDPTHCTLANLFLRSGFRSRPADYSVSSNSMANGASVEQRQTAGFVQEQPSPPALLLVVPNGRLWQAS